ncbi:uncharacterized protein LOC119654760 [Hermetia illucens]|uniref:uncharacterized protein LOC119654760 n=1 Tax=Hermetia illucens TaxID=343691 RepID=UPI0018CBF8CC|nr:uncharacterized protein LOC119654760 [Hermetia illucens]
MAEWVKVKRQKRGAAPALLPDEALSEASLDSAPEEEERAASESRRITPAEKIAGPNKIIFQQNRNIAELRSQIAQLASNQAATHQPSVASAPATHPSTTQGASNDAKKRASEKVPPIIIMEEDSAILQIISAHLDKLPNKFTMKKGAKCTKVLVNSIKEFDDTKRFLSTNDKKFFSYTPKCEKPVNMILRGLHSFHPRTDVMTALAQAGRSEATDVRQYETQRSIQEKRDLNLWLVSFKPGFNIAKLARTKTLLHTVVRFEAVRNKRTMQCKNCQRLGNAAANCFMPYRYVKCVDSHAPGKCTKSTEEKH